MAVGKAPDARHCARGCAQLLGVRWSILKQQRRLKKKKNLSTAERRKSLGPAHPWLMAQVASLSPSLPPGTRGVGLARNCGMHSLPSLNATVAHSWTSQLLGNERIFSSPLPLFPSLRVSSRHGIIYFSSSKDIPFP